MISIFHIIAGSIIGHLFAIIYLDVDCPLWLCVLAAMFIPIFIYLGYNQTVKYGMDQGKKVAKILNPDIKRNIDV